MLDSDNLADEFDSVHTLLLPFIEQVRLGVADTSASDTPSPAALDGQKARQAWQYRVLIADDDDNIGDLLELSLADEKCEIIRAKNGTKVIEALASLLKQHGSSALDLIILDVNMPELNGFDVLKSIKRSAITANIPVIMLTRRDEDESIIQGISHGAVDYVIKPFDIADLVVRIKKSLKRHRTTILVADDDEIVRNILAQRFQLMGYTVVAADNGNDAWQKMHSQKPDLVLLDIMMPGLDGLALLHKAKSDLTTASIPIIILTAKRQQENILLGLEGGAHDYISKPFDLDEIAARVGGVLQRARRT